MVNDKLQIVQEQLAALTFDEKQKLTAFLIEQLKRDVETNGQVDEETKGHHHDANVPAPTGEPDPNRQLEYAWLKKHSDEYAGQYVALSGNQLVAAAPSLKELYQLVGQSNVYRPFFVRIEAEDEPPFGGW